VREVGKGFLISVPFVIAWKAHHLGERRKYASFVKKYDQMVNKLKEKQLIEDALKKRGNAS